MHLTASRRAGKRVGGGDDLPLNPAECPRATCSQLIAGAVCVWGGRGTSLSRRVGKGGGRSYTHPIISRLGCAHVSSTPHPHSHRFCLRLNVAFGLMSVGLMLPSALCRSRPIAVWPNVVFGLMSFGLVSFGLMSHLAICRSA